MLFHSNMTLFGYLAYILEKVCFYLMIQESLSDD